MWTFEIYFNNKTADKNGENLQPSVRHGCEMANVTEAGLHLEC